LAVATGDGAWSDDACTNNLHAVCSFSLAVCANGQQDATNGETGVDCGGPCGACPPKFSSAMGESGTVTATGSLTFTLTFSESVSGVTATEFGVATTGGLTLASTVASASGGAVDAVWVLTAAVVSPIPSGVGTASVTMPASSPHLSPPVTTTAINNGFSLSFQPVTVTLSSTQSQPLVAPRLLYTATFSRPVTGLNASAFAVLVPSGATPVTTLTAVSGTQYVLAVELTSVYLATNVSVTLRDGVVSPPNSVSPSFDMLYRPLAPTAYQLGSLNTANPIGSTDSGVGVVVLDFGTPVSGVTNTTVVMGLSINATVAVTSAAGDGSSPAQLWHVTITAVPDTSSGTAMVYLSVANTVTPRPAYVATPLFTMFFTPPSVSGQEANSGATGPAAASAGTTDFTWFGIVGICAVVVLATVVGCLAMFKASHKVDHQPPLAAPGAMATPAGNQVAPAPAGGGGGGAVMTGSSETRSAAPV